MIILCMLQVQFLTPFRTPAASSVAPPKQYDSIRELDECENWTERATVITKEQHEEYIKIAQQVVSQIIETLPLDQVLVFLIL